MIGRIVTALRSKLSTDVKTRHDHKSRRVLPVLPAITLLAMLGPVIAGLYGTILPAFGHLPAAGLTGPTPKGGLLSEHTPHDTWQTNWAMSYDR